MRSFADIYETAVQLRGGVSQLESMLPKPLSEANLQELPDQYFLSNLSRRVFRAGLKHDMVDKKWPMFESVFKGFDPLYCAMLSDEGIEQLMGDGRIIRHLPKIRSIRDNALFVREQANQYGSFGQYLATWPSDNIVELWLDLKRKGKQLGGASGPSFLRMVGKDTFLLTPDVVSVLMLEKVIDKHPTSKRDMLAAQAKMLQWQDESGRFLCEISRIVSFTAM